MLKWNIAAASVKGLTHEGHEPCEDAYYYKRLQDGTLLAALADGAGSKSAPLSALGARLAVKSSVTYLDRVLRRSQVEMKKLMANRGKDLITAAMQHSRLCLELAARDYETTKDAFACTLLLVAAKPTQMIYGQVGDGGIVYKTQMRNGIFNLTLCSDPEWKKVEVDESEFVNHTYFITSGDVWQNLYCGSTNEELLGVVLYTDGLDRIVINKKDGMPRESFTNGLLSAITEEQENATISCKLDKDLRMLKARKQTHDDMTILVANPQIS